MKNAIKKICEIGSLPFNKSKASDEYIFAKELPDFLKSFRYQCLYKKSMIINKAFIDNK